MWRPPSPPLTCSAWTSSPTARAAGWWSPTGHNARLAAKLTGFKIDIKPASDPGELPDPEEDLLVVDDGDEPAEELLEEPVGEAPEESSNDIQV